MIKLSDQQENKYLPCKDTTIYKREDMKNVHLVFGFDFIVAATGHLSFNRQLATKLSRVALRGNAGATQVVND